MTSSQKVNFNAPYLRVQQGTIQNPSSSNSASSPLYIPPQNNSDVCDFSSDMSANLKFDAEQSVAGPVYSGKINSKAAIFKIIDEDELAPLYYEGFIDNKKLQLESLNNICKGKYGDKEFELAVEYNEPSKISNFFNQTIMGKSFKPDFYNVKGKVGDKEVEINLPNAKTPDDEDVKDILSLMLFSNGLEVRTYDDEIVALDYSNLKRSDIRKSLKKRSERYNEDVKPLISQAISTASGIIIGAVMTTLLGKLKLHK